MYVYVCTYINETLLINILINGGFFMTGLFEFSD